MNAAALLTLGGIAPDYRTGFTLAMSILESGKALSRLEKFAAMSHGGEMGEEETEAEIEVEVKEKASHVCA